MFTLIVLNSRAASCAVFLGVLICCCWTGWAQALERIVEENSPGVLVIVAEHAATGRESQGSGFVIDADGWVLSTAHQVQGAGAIEGRFEDGRRVALEIVALDEARDLALLRSGEALPRALRLGDAETLRTGAPLWTIAAPRQLDFTVTQGIVSHRERSYRGFRVLQTDLGAAPGSSGAPVFDRSGAVVGMVLMHLEGETWATFVNPINHALPLLREAGLLGSGQPVEDDHALLDEDLLLPASDISELEQRAIDAYNRGVRAATYEEKREAYTLARTLLPEFYEAVFNLAVVCQQLGDYEAADAEYARALRIRRNAPEVYRNLGRLYLELDRDQAALEMFETAYQLLPDAPQSHNDLGEAYRRLGDLEVAAEAFQTAIALAPDYAVAYYNLGLVQVERNQLDEARRHFQRFLALRPDSADAAEVQAWVELLD